MLTLADVLTTCAVVIFSVKMSWITSVDCILTLIIDLIGQLSRDVVGRLSVKPCWFWLNPNVIGMSWCHSFTVVYF